MHFSKEQRWKLYSYNSTSIHPSTSTLVNFNITWNLHLSLASHYGYIWLVFYGDFALNWLFVIIFYLILFAAKKIIIFKWFCHSFLFFKCFFEFWQPVFCLFLLFIRIALQIYTNLTEVNDYDTSHMPFGLQVFYYPFFLP